MGEVENNVNKIQNDIFKFYDQFEPFSTLHCGKLHFPISKATDMKSNSFFIKHVSSFKLKTFKLLKLMVLHKSYLITNKLILCLLSSLSTLFQTPPLSMKFRQGILYQEF